jgi:hypothetical protein
MVPNRGAAIVIPHVPVTPEEIIDTIVDELEAETAPSRYSVLVRSVFHVFLHSADFAALRPVFAHIEDEAVRALNERLAALNKRSMLDAISPSASRKKSYRRIGDGDWKIVFYENHDAESAQNPLIVRSLSMSLVRAKSAWERPLNAPCGALPTAPSTNRRRRRAVNPISMRRWNTKTNSVPTSLKW